MSNNSEQNGRQATPHTQPTAPPTDPRRRNVSVTVPSAAPSDQPPICRDNIWGICSLGSQCKYRHQLDYESMRAVLKFCHEFQNRTGCNRPDCTYLHTSREEENLFLSSGVIPRVLAERYAAMARMSGTTDHVAAGPHMMYDYVQQPPPPPAPAPAAPHPPSAVAQSAHLPMTSMPMVAPINPFLPPPPPPPPPTTTTTSTRNVAPVYTSSSVSHSLQPTPVPQPPPMLPPTFDPSRPPPPVPPQSHCLKRPADNSEAGPSCKLRISDCTPDGPCDTCIQREIRIQIYKQEMEKLQQEEEIQQIIHNKKSEEFENTKLLLKSALSPQVYRIIEEYVEGLTPNNTLLSQTKPSSFTSGTSTVPRQFLMQLIECVFGGNLRSSIDAVPSTSQQGDSILQTLTALARRQNNPMNSMSGASPDVLQALLAALQNNVSSDGAVAGPSGVTPVTNGVSRLASGGGAAATASPSAAPTVPVRPSGSPRYPTGSPQYPAPAPRYPASGTAPPPPTYMTYPPAAMPPPTPPGARPYYMSYGDANTSSGVTYNGNLRPPPPTPHGYPQQHFPGRYPPYYPPAPPHQ